MADSSQGIPVIYFGAHHWHWEEDSAIGQVALKGGVINASTDAVESTLAFDITIDPSVP